VLTALPKIASHARLKEPRLPTIVTMTRLGVTLAHCVQRNPDQRSQQARLIPMPGNRDRPAAGLNSVGRRRTKSHRPQQSSRTAPRAGSTVVQVARGDHAETFGDGPCYRQDIVTCVHVARFSVVPTRSRGPLPVHDTNDESNCTAKYLSAVLRHPGLIPVR